MMRYLVVAEPVVVERGEAREVARPHYEKTNAAYPQSKQMAVDQDPPAKYSCNSCVWALLALLALALIALALLYGLGVIGGSGNAEVDNSSSTTSAVVAGPS